MCWRETARVVCSVFVLLAYLEMSTAIDVKELLGGTAEIKPEDVHFDPRRDRLGGGTFGDVYRGLLLLPHVVFFCLCFHVCEYALDE